MAKPFVWMWLIGIALSGQALPSEGAIIAKIAESGESIEMESVGQSEGRKILSSLTLYTNGAVRYFSAGVGLEERSAQYPQFLLKKGEEAIVIPPEQVEGPWLFVDLPPGLYDLSGTFSGDVRELSGIQIESGRQRVIHFRWEEDRGSPVRIAEDVEVGRDAGPLGKEAR